MQVEASRAGLGVNMAAIVDLENPSHNTLTHKITEVTKNIPFSSQKDINIDCCYGSKKIWRSLVGVVLIGLGSAILIVGADRTSTNALGGITFGLGVVQIIRSFSFPCDNLSAKDSARMDM